MTPQEASKIIADFMGWELDQSFTVEIDKNSGDKRIVGYLPHEDLNVSVLAWKRVKCNFTLYHSIIENPTVTAYIGYFHQLTINETLQEAACLATAKAILELNKEREK